MLKILCGADPELFILKGSNIIPCVGLFPGTKDEPSPVKGSKVGLKIQEDNVTLELGWDPVDLSRFHNNTVTAYREAASEVARTLGKDCSLHIAPYWEFKAHDLMSDQAKTFGCSSDMLAHQKGAVRAPLDSNVVGNIRCAAGHIHVGYNRQLCTVPDWAIVQFMDLAYLFAIEDGVDRQGPRRKFYGLPGLYRRKEYGLEYRTPSNFWLRSVAYTTSMFKMAQNVINKPSKAREMWGRIPWELVQKSIMEEHLHVGDSIHSWYNEINEAPYEAIEGDTDSTNDGISVKDVIDPIEVALG